MIGNVVYTTDLCNEGTCWTIEPEPGGTGNALISNAIGFNEMSFGPGQFAHAIGFLLFLPGSNPPSLGWQIMVNELNGQTSVINVPQTTIRQAYFGFLSDVGIDKVTV
jgi:hypothetical protein